MNERIDKTNCGYCYDAAEDADWSVVTDYRHQKIYLSAPYDDEDIDAICDFGKAIAMAVRDMKRDTKGWE